MAPHWILVAASTITQQVVKQLLLTPEKSMRRKVQEIILARRLTQRFSKEEVLASYLNQMYFGHGRYGVEQAARYFFGKSISDVDVGAVGSGTGAVVCRSHLVWVLGAARRVSYRQTKWCRPHDPGS